MAVFLLFPALYSIYETLNFILTHPKAQGVVVDWVPEETEGLNIFTTIVPKVMFRNKNNFDVVFISKFTGGFQPKINEKVTVYYDEKDNDKAMINTFGMVWCLPIVSLIIGSIFLVRILSILKLLKVKKKG